MSVAMAMAGLSAIPSGPVPFDLYVPNDGYAWWYVDAISDDGEYALSLIFFVGSVFSWRYAKARQNGPADPMDYCAINLALYRPKGKHWALSEWPREHVRRGPEDFVIGANQISWRDGMLEVQIDERSAPFARPVKGQLRLYPEQLFAERYPLDLAGQHFWQPIAPSARVRLDFQQPALRFSGEAYWDSNFGMRPLEQDFSSWNWSRAELSQGSAVLYDVERRVGPALRLAKIFAKDGQVKDLAAPDWLDLPKGFWAEPRATRVQAGGAAKVLRNLESSPFYARSLISTQLLGQSVKAIHESLSLDRFRQTWVQRLLPFKTRRWSPGSGVGR